jgi:pyruvate dehydrogenase E2 component (dihydrolipoamide acetyltransferase)
MSMQPIPIEMPQLSSEGEAATLATWLVSVGDRVEKGDVIAELETDKATVELESPASGTLAELLVSEGSEGILPGITLGRIAPDEGRSDDGASVERAKSTPDTPAESAPAREAAPAARPEPAAAPASGATAAGTPGLRGSTPLARRAAAQHEVDLATVEGSGPGGRVVEADILRLRESEPEAQGTGTAAAASAVRAATGTLTRADSPIAAGRSVLQLGIRCPMDSALAALSRLGRAEVKPGDEASIGLEDLVLRAVALALRAVPEANVGWVGDQLEAFDRVDLSIPVAAKSGWIAGVLRDADRMGLSRLSAERRSLASLAQDGTLESEPLAGGTFGVCDLGLYGIATVVPSLSPPQTCQLGVGAVEERPVVRDGQVVVGHVAALVLAADSRAVNEAVAARFLGAVREHLEDPLGMML